MSESQFWFKMLMLFLIAIILGFLPTIIASARRHTDKHEIAQLNFMALLFWPAWAQLLPWAMGAPRNEKMINRWFGPPGKRGRLGMILAVGIGICFLAVALPLAFRSLYEVSRRFP